MLDLLYLLEISLGIVIVIFSLKVRGDDFTPKHDNRLSESQGELDQEDG